MTFDLERIRTAIAAAPLPPKPPVRLGMAPAAAPVLTGGTPQALVVGSDVVSFATAIAGEHRQAIADSMLLAQFMANAKVPGEGDPVGWFDTYVGALGSFGWRTLANDGTTYAFEGKGLEVHKAILEVVGVLLAGAPIAIKLVETTLKALGTMSKDSPLITLFNRETQHARAGRFQVATVRHEADGTAVVEIMAFALTADKTVTQILFFKLHADESSLQSRRGTLALDDATMRDIAPLLRARVVAYRAAFIGAIPLPPLPAV